jgi:hypothetical protein
VESGQAGDAAATPGGSAANSPELKAPPQPAGIKVTLEATVRC